MKRKNSLLRAVPFVIASMLAAPYAMAAPAGDIRVAVGVEPDGFDPLISRFPIDFSINLLTLDGLFRLDGENNIQNNLATEYSYSEDGMVLTVKMVTGRHFSNGDPLNAEAVAASFNRLLDPANGSQFAALYKTLGTAKAVGEDTVEFHLSERNGHALTLLASTTGSIVNVKAAEEMGADYNLRPVGSGPYMVDEYIGGERFTLVPNPNYDGPSPATLEKIEYIIVPEDGSRMALLETGEADIVERVPPEARPTIDALDNAESVVFPSNFSINMELVRKGVLEDPKVREAMSLAVDRKGITTGVLGGLGTPTVGMIGPGTQDSLRVTFDEIPYDPEKAKALLAEAGYQPGQISLTMTCPTGRYIKDAQVCQALQAQWQAIGINVQADVVDRGTWGAVIALPPDERKDNMALVGRASAGMDFTLYRLFHSESGVNRFAYKSDDVDSLLAEGRTTTDLEAQKEIYGKVQKVIWEDQPFIYLWYQKQVLGVADRVKGLMVRPDETILFDGVTVTE